MNTFTQIEEHIDLKFFKEVKEQIDDLYESQRIFILSLETLELTRRFNNQYHLLDNQELVEPVALNKFVSLTHHLERNLTLELQ